MREADLTGADLTAANLADVNLRRANLTGACLLDANLNGAAYDSKTAFPDGFNAAANGLVLVEQGDPIARAAQATDNDSAQTAEKTATEVGAE
jgi:hypothetical protein